MPTLVRAEETIVIAAEDDWAPYSSSRPGQADPAGFAVDLVREAFKTQGIAVRFQTVPFSRCMYLAKAGAVAGCFNATILDTNRDGYTWHVTPMFHEDVAIYGPANATRGDLKLADLEGRTVGYTLGYTYMTEFQDNPRIKRRTVRSDALLLQMLAAGRLDYILMNSVPGQLQINKNATLKGRVKKVGTISRDGFWVAFAKAPDSQRLADAFDKGLLELKTSGRYKTMREALEKQIGP